MLPAELEDALQHERALRRLAASLCASPADADDAVQHTLSQVALGRRPHDMPLLAFLRTTLRNCARNLQKVAHRRRLREGAAARASVALPVDELLAREQLRRRLAAVVMALDEPYRTTVWLRWFEDVPVAAIAQRMQVPANTVRTRLQRAHSRLRERLGREYGERDWAVLAAPIVNTAPAIGGTALLLAGGLAVKKSVIALLCIAALVAAIVWMPSAQHAPEPPPAKPAVEVETATAPPHDAPVREPVAAAQDVPTYAPPAAPVVARDPTEPELAPFAAAVEPGCVEGILLRLLEPVGGGRAWLCGMKSGGLPWGPTSGWDAATGVHTTAIDAAGLFRFAGLEPDTYAVGVQAPDGATRRVYVDVPNGAEITLRIRIVLGTATVRGRVFDGNGQIAPLWHVALWNHGGMPAGTQLILGTVADARGEIEFTGLCGGTYHLQASPTENFAVAERQELTLQLGAGETRSVLVGSPAAACDWRGRVLLPGGQALALLMFVELELAVDGTVSHHRLDAEGAFQARVLAGRYEASLRIATGARVAFGAVEVPAGAWVHDVVTPNVVRIRPTFPASSGASTAPRPATTARLRARSGFTIDSARGVDGFEYFLGVAAGDYLLQCWPQRIAGAPASGMPVTVPAAGELEVDVVVEPH